VQFPLILLFRDYDQRRYVFGKVNVLEQLDNAVAFVSRRCQLSPDG